jgi:DHA1 family multidrug resistance protein-like MFS transporter
MLFAARALGGLVSSATLPTAMAYVGDCTSEEDRGGGMGAMGAAMGLGAIVGPGLGGWLAGDALSTPFTFAAALCLAALLLIALFLPESLPRDAQRREAPHQGGGHAARLLRVPELWETLLGPIGVLLGLAFLVSLGVNNFSGVFGLYALEKYGYGPHRVGTVMMAMGGASVIAQGLLVGPLTKRWGEAAVIRLSLLGSSIAFVTLLLVQGYAGILLASSFFILNKTLLRPAVVSLTSRRSPVGQGTAMGLSNAAMSLGRVAGPVWAGFAFDLNADLPYLSGAVILFVGFLVSLIWVRQEPATASKTAPAPKPPPVAHSSGTAERPQRLS